MRELVRHLTAQTLTPAVGDPLTPWWPMFSQNDDRLDQ